jgi:hypothetical protein
MNLIARGLFVVGGIAVGSFLINHYLFGNTGDALLRSDRIGESRKADVREACFPAMEYPERDTMAPKMPAGQHRVSPSDHRRAVELTVALNCYLVTKAGAICQPDNRAYILARSDFGFASPEPLQPLLAQHKQSADTCPPLTRGASAS